MVLAQETRCLLLDEPTTFLDLRNQMAVMGVIDALRDELKITILTTCHDLNLAVQHADHLLVMSRGKLSASGTPAKVVTAEMLRDVFGIEAEILRSAKGIPICVPRGICPRHNR